MPTRVPPILPNGILPQKLTDSRLKPQKMDAADLAAYQNKGNDGAAGDGTLLSDKGDAEGI